MISDDDSAVMEYSPDVVNSQMSLPDGIGVSPSSDSVVDVDGVKRQISESAGTSRSDADQAGSMDTEDQALEPEVGPGRACGDTRPYLVILGIAAGMLLRVVTVVLALRFTKRDVA